VKVLNAAGLFAAMIRPQHARFLIVDSSIRSWLLACNVTPANHSADGSGFVPPDLDLLKGPRVKRGPLFSPTRFAEVERQAVSATQRNPNGKERWTRGLHSLRLGDMREWDREQQRAAVVFDLKTSACGIGIPPARYKLFYE
jgi:hypothetical protein